MLFGIAFNQYHSSSRLRLITPGVKTCKKPRIHIFGQQIFIIGADFWKKIYGSKFTTLNLRQACFSWGIFKMGKTSKYPCRCPFFLCYISNVFKYQTKPLKYGRRVFTLVFNERAKRGIQVFEPNHICSQNKYWKSGLWRGWMGA